MSAIHGRGKDPAKVVRLIPKLGNLDSWCPTLCGVDRIVNASRIKCLDGRDKPAATPHMGREQRELVLIARGPPIAATDIMGRNETWVGRARAWIVEVINVVELAIPTSENAYRRSIIKAAEHGSALERVQTISHVLPSLLQDIDAGLISSLSNKVRAEVFDDFLDHAVAYQQQKKKNEAGVIAGVVFEDTVRRIYSQKIGDNKGAKLEDIINELAKKDVITGQQSKQAKVAAHVRTKASHAQWDEFDLQGVEATIQITRSFLAEHLGG